MTPLLPVFVGAVLHPCPLLRIISRVGEAKKGSGVLWLPCPACLVLWKVRRENLVWFLARAALTHPQLLILR